MKFLLRLEQWLDLQSDAVDEATNPFSGDIQREAAAQAADDFESQIADYYSYRSSRFLD